MKKLFTLLLVLASVVVLVACKPSPGPGPGGDDPWDETATYLNYISSTSNLNPYSQTLANASTLYDYVTDGLYAGDYDWAKAIEDGLAEFEGDFSQGAENLPYGRFPRMAASEPVDVNGDGITWEITLRDDLQFEDGTPINAETYNYSWQQLLSPYLLNDRASNLFGSTYLPLVNAQSYHTQLVPDKDAAGFEKYTVGLGTSSEVVYARANSHQGVDSYGDAIYTPEPSSYDTLVGPEGELPYVANWSAYGTYAGSKNGWVLQNIAGSAFRLDADGNLLAPTAGWTLDGEDVPVINAEGSAPAVNYVGLYPAFADEDGNQPELDANGIPVGGEFTYEDAVEVPWSDVGFEVVGPLTFRVTLTQAKTDWDVKGALTSGITGVVHPVQYAAGLNEAGTLTTYGTIDNPLISYGPYKLVTWQDDVVFVYEINENHFAADDYRIKRVRFDVINDQSIAVDEFKAGRLDVASASGDYYQEFQDSPYLRLSPITTFFRFAFNVRGKPTTEDGEYAQNPILVYEDFRKAFYFAIDREEFVTTVRPPGVPTQTFLGPVYLATEFASVSYRASDAGVGVSADLYPETYGYNPVQAKELFDAAYAQAVADGNITNGSVVAVEYKYFTNDANDKIAEWTKSTVEAIFGTDKFRLDLAGVSSAALSAAWDSGDFDVTFGGWQGLQFNAASMLGQVYNSNLTYMLEIGFDTGNTEVTVNLAASKAALEAWIADYGTIAEPTDAQTASYDSWVALLAKFEGNNLTVTYNELFNYAYGELYNARDVNYEGKVDDFNRIAAALESVLLDQMIAIPLFTNVSAAVYSSRIVFEADSYHAWMGWGGLKYMYIAKPTTGA